MISRCLSYWSTILLSNRSTVRRLFPVYVVLLSVTLLLWQDQPGQAIVDFTYPAQQPVTGNALFITPDRFLNEHDSSTSVAWGDVDNDGDLDLAIGNSTKPLVLYENQNGVINEEPLWSSSVSDQVFSIAWGDVNGDGYLDLAVGSAAQPVKVYMNNSGRLLETATWQSADINPVRTIAWGDVNGDGRLDLAVGAASRPVKIYLNLGTQLNPTADWTSSTTEAARSVAWGDADNDGDLDLAVGTTQFNKVYFFNSVNGSLEQQAYWEFNEPASTRVIAWGDMNGDGWLDLAVGNEDAPVKVYQNDQNRTFATTDPTKTWSSSEQNKTQSLAWGDMDADGDLDLVVANFREETEVGLPIRIYRSSGRRLEVTAAWSSLANDGIRSIALGDMDSDGDLDFAAAAFGTDFIYRNRTGLIQATSGWRSDLTDTTNSVAWGDVDGDGDLDLAVGNGILTTTTGLTEPDYVYRNTGGAFTLMWSSPNKTRTRSLAWGDVDGDGDLDLALGNMGLVTGDGASNEIFRNDGGTLTPSSSWTSFEKDDTTSIAWGDVDGDGDLDLAAGNHEMPNRVYKNDGGVLAKEAAWSSGDDPSMTMGVAWGDMDNDGDLDLAVVSSDTASKVYLNQQGQLQVKPTWTSADISDARAVAWGDMNGDGWLDLAVGCDGQPAKVYLNVQGQLQPAASWLATNNLNARSVAWGDVDADGDLDLAIGNDNEPNKIYLNEQGMLGATAAWQAPTANNTRSVAWGDWDGDGDLDLAVGNGGTGPNAVRNNQIYLNQRAAHPLPGQPSTQLPTIALSLNSNPVRTFNDNITTALAPANFYATAAIRQTNLISLSYTLYDPDSAPVRQIRVYYSLNGSFSGPRSSWHRAYEADGTAETTLSTAPYPAGRTHTFLWDVGASGFFGQSDNVVVRIEAVPSYQPRPYQAPGPYQRSFIATQSYPFRARGMQVRVLNQNEQPVSNAQIYQLPKDFVSGGLPMGSPMVPFQTDSQGYLSGRGALRLGDELIALQPVTVTKQYTIYYTSASATSNLAVGPGGFATHEVKESGVQTLRVSPQNPLLLFDLAVSLQWDASNDPGFLGQLQQDLQKTSIALYDWTNGQVALGDVTVYQAKEQWDNADVRIYASNQVRPVANRGGVVHEQRIIPLPAPHEPITATRGEIRIGAVWNRYGDPTPTGDDWPNVLAHELGHYLLFLEDSYLGLDPDSGLLIPVTTCTGTAMTDPYDEESSELRYDLPNWRDECGHSLAELPDWSLMRLAYPALRQPADPNNGPPFLPFAFTRVAVKAAPSGSRALLIDATVPLNGNDATLANSRAYLRVSGEQLVDLGRPVLGSVLARGAREGDEICLFAEQHFACTDLKNSAPAQLQPKSIWNPEIELTPINTTTFRLLVNSPGVSQVTVTVYPNGRSPRVHTLAPGVAQTLILAEPAVEVWLDLVGNQPDQRMITEYVVGSGPGRLRSHDGPGRLRSHDGPFTSGDGRVTLYPPEAMAADTFIALQTATKLPALPAGTTVIGRSYYVRPSNPSASLAEGSIVFQYLGLDVLLSGLPEANLTVYYWNGTVWQKLETKLNTVQNFASAPLIGSGLYILSSSYYQPLYGPGWNTVPYPASLPAQPVAAALASLQGAYTVAYGCEPGASANPWQLYAPGVPAWVNDLSQMEPQKVYQLYVTQSVTWTVSQPRVEAALNNPCSQPPPATIYGALPATVADNAIVTAQIAGETCGQGTVRTANGQKVFVVKVAADGLQATSHCGRQGKMVSLALAGQATWQANWDNTKVVMATLVPIVDDPGDGDPDDGDPDDGDPDGEAGANRLLLPIVMR